MIKNHTPSALHHAGAFLMLKLPKGGVRLLVIDGKKFNIPVKKLTRKAEFLDKFAQRTEDGVLQRELIGVYFNYQLQLGSTTNTAEYQRLWAKLTEPVEFHTVTVPDESGDYTFIAYVSNVGDEIRKQEATRNYWKNLTVNFIAKAPARSR